MKINFPLLALAIGAFGIGTTEFSPMGLLPVIAKGVDVSIPVAGMLISAYAIGVMVGAPLMTLLLSHRARRNALIFLMGSCCMAANAGRYISVARKPSTLRPASQTKNPFPGCDITFS